MILYGVTRWKMTSAVAKIPEGSVVTYDTNIRLVTDLNTGKFIFDTLPYQSTLKVWAYDKVELLVKMGRKEYD